MSANESEAGAPETRLREAKKQVKIARDQLDEDDESQFDLGEMEDKLGIVADAVEERDAA